MLRYREIKQELQNIIAGMNNGDRLPSRMILCKQLDTSRATIDKAIRELEEENILQSRLGSGTFVARRLEGVVNNVMNWCLIVPNVTEDIYSKMARGINCEAKKWNINLIICNSENSSEKQSDYIKRLLMAGVDGFIIVPVVLNSVMESVGLYQSLIRSKIPFVFCNRDVDGVIAPIVKSNDFYGGYIATRHLIAQGYENIAFLSRKRYRTSIERCQGYISALQEQGIEINRKRILMLEDSAVEKTYDALADFLKTDTPVDAVFCFNDSIAFEAMRAVKDRNLRVSDDIGIIGYDDNEGVGVWETRLTTISYHPDVVGKMAAQVLYGKIKKNQEEAFEYFLVEPSLVVRDSCLGKR